MLDNLGGLNEKLNGNRSGGSPPVQIRRVLHLDPLGYRVVVAQSFEPVTKVIRILGAPPQRGMDGRETDDDDTLERHTDTNKLTRHTASGLPHILSGRTHHSGHVPPVAPPSTPRCQETNNSTTTQTGDRGERVRLEQACSASSNLVAGRKAWTRSCVGSCEVSMWTLSSQASCLLLALTRTHGWCQFIV